MYNNSDSGGIISIVLEKPFQVVSITVLVSILVQTPLSHKDAGNKS